MGYPLLQKCKYYLAGTLVIAHLITCLLAQWLHQHGGHNHFGLKGCVYQLRIPAFLGEMQEFDQAQHDPDADLHLLKRNSPDNKLQDARTGQSGHHCALDNFVPPIDSCDSPIVENSPPYTAFKTAFKLAFIQTAREYFVLPATGLSPPLS